MSLLELVDVTVSYGAVVAVRSVSVTVEAGEVLAVLGANGAGKTSLLRAATGLEPLAGGDVRVDGTSVAGRRPEQVARLDVAHVPRPPRPVPRPHRRREPADGPVRGGARRHRRGARGTRRRPRHVPDPGRARRPARRQPVRRPAPDAQHRPGPAPGPAAAPARRDVDGARRPPLTRGDCPVCGLVGDPRFHPDQDAAEQRPVTLAVAAMAVNLVVFALVAWAVLG